MAHYFRSMTVLLFIAVCPSVTASVALGEEVMPPPEIRRVRQQTLAPTPARVNAIPDRLGDILAECHQYRDGPVWGLAKRVPGQDLAYDEMGSATFVRLVQKHNLYDKVGKPSEADLEKVLEFWKNWQDSATGRFKDPRDPDRVVNEKYIVGLIRSLGGQPIVPWTTTGDKKTIETETFLRRTKEDPDWAPGGWGVGSHTGLMAVEILRAINEKDRTDLIPDLERGMNQILSHQDPKSGLWGKPGGGLAHRIGGNLKVIGRFYFGMGTQVPHTRQLADTLIENQRNGQWFAHGADSCVPRNVAECVAYCLEVSDYRRADLLDTLARLGKDYEHWVKPDGSLLMQRDKPDSVGLQYTTMYALGILGGYLNWEGCRLPNPLDGSTRGKGMRYRPVLQPDNTVKIIDTQVTSSTRQAEGDRGERPPNFVVIMADDLGATELGCYGNKAHRTPRLDRLAETGVRFRTCWSTPLCSPTRVEIMTGRYGFRTGWYNFLGRVTTPLDHIDPDELTFADMLKARGYATALAGKWQLGTITAQPTMIYDSGFDAYCTWAWIQLPLDADFPGSPRQRFWHPAVITNGKHWPTTTNEYGPDVYTNWLIEFMRTNRDRPFLAYYPMCLTHKPWEPTPIPGSPGKKTPEGLKANVEYMDHVVGRIADALDDMGLRENTIIMFTGDNGTAGAGKGKTIERGVRVPMIVNCPGRVKPALSDDLVDLSDVLPTLAELGGADLPSGVTIDGRSFAPQLAGKKGKPRDWIFSYLAYDRMLRDKRWLLEGDGKLYDCGDCRDGSAYRDVTDSTDPEVVAARKCFEAILEDLPAPKKPDKPKAKKRGKG